MGRLTSAAVVRVGAHKRQLLECVRANRDSDTDASVCAAALACSGRTGPPVRARRAARRKCVVTVTGGLSRAASDLDSESNSDRHGVGWLRVKS